jgi:hypothetical protein
MSGPDEVPDDPWYEKDRAQVGTLSEFFNYISRFREPSVLIVVSTIIFYYIVSSYYNSYFGKLNIPLETLDIGFAFTLAAGQLIGVGLLNIIGLMVFVYFFVNPSGKDDVRIFTAIYVFFIVLMSTLSLSLSILSVALLYTFPRIIEFFKTASEEDILLKEYYKKRDPKNTIEIIGFLLIIVILFIYMFCGYIPSIAGEVSAEKLVTGLADNPEITLYLKNNTTSNTTYILAAHNRAKYYLFKKYETIPNKLELYIIPDDQIKTIIATKSNSNLETALPNYIIKKEYLNLKNWIKYIKSICEQANNSIVLR